MKWNNLTREWELLESTCHNEKVVWPINSNDEEMTWGYGIETLREKLALSQISATTDAEVMFGFDLKGI